MPAILFFVIDFLKLYMIHKDRDCAWADIDKQFSSCFHMSPVLVKIECHFSLYISCPFTVIHPLRQLAMLHFASLPFLCTFPLWANFP